MARVERRPQRRRNGHDSSTSTTEFVPVERDGGMRSTIVEGAKEALRGFGILRKTKYGLGPLMFFIFLGITGGFDGGAFSVALPFILRDLELDAGQVLTIRNFAGFATIMLTVWFGFIADKINRKYWVGGFSIASGLASLWTSTANNLVTIGLSRAGDTVSDSARSVPIFSMLADYYEPDKRGRAIALQGVVVDAATLGAPLVVGWLIDSRTTDEFHPAWRLPFVLTGVGLVVFGILVLALVKEPVRGYWERKAIGATEEDASVEEERPSFGEAWRITWSIRTLRRLFIAGALADVRATFYGYVFVLYIFEQYSLSALQIGAFAALTGVGGLIGGFFAGGIVDRLMRLRPQRILVLTGVLGLISSVFAFIIPAGIPLSVFGAVSFFLGFFGALLGPARSALTVQIVPPQIRTLGVSVFALTGILGTIMWVLLGNPVGSQWGFRGVLFAAAPFAVLSSLVNLSAAELFEPDMRSAQKASLAAQEAEQAKHSGAVPRVLICRGVDVGYDGVQVLFDVDFDVEEGEIVALLGTNGAGKSTLLRAISGTQQATSGGIIFDGRDITHMPPHEIAKRGVIHMPGGRGIFPELSVRENLLLGNWLTPQGEEAGRLAEVHEFFPILKERANERAGALSGGEQQMLSLAQAFLAKPKLLLIDELSLGLSPAVVGELVEIVKRINATGVTVIVVEQSVNVALTVAKRAVFMEKGEVRFVGETKELLNRPDILRAVYVKGTGALTSSPARAQRSEQQRRREALEEARTLLDVQGVSKSFGGITAVDDVNFELREGESLGLIGPNGAGKTTLFDLISGYQKADAGKIIFDGVDVTKMGADERARRQLVRRFQDARLFPSLTVYENLLVALDRQLDVRSAAMNALQLPQVRSSERRVRVRADRLIELLDLHAFRDKFVKELSTGLRRITDLACVLATEPKVLMLDEPSTGIAQAEAEQLAPLLRRVRVETGCSMLVIEHDMPLISQLSDELLALDQGAVVTRGTPTDVLNDTKVVESYLGTSESAIQRSGRKG